ncbi:MAG: hypothetical protein LLG97_21095 [Deltaproteobacteria bacterium]|nr:hypothetical protein [Deltaproteobacteria bacterium]
MGSRNFETLPAGPSGSRPSVLAGRKSFARGPLPAGFGRGLKIPCGRCHSHRPVAGRLARQGDRIHEGQSHSRTHLGPASDRQKERGIEALRDFGIERLSVSHCTGLETACWLAAEFGERFFFCAVEMVVEG